MPLKIAEGKANIITTFFTVLLYGLFMYCFQMFLYKSWFFTNFPVRESLFRYDAPNFYELANKGYTPEIPSHLFQDQSFLFAWIWRVFTVDAFVMSSINLVIYAIGFSVVSSLYKLSTDEKLIWLTLPTGY